MEDNGLFTSQFGASSIRTSLNNYYSDDSDISFGVAKDGRVFMTNSKEDEEKIVDKIISKLIGEDNLDAIFGTLMSKLSEYLESDDNKELLKDFIDHKLNEVKNDLGDKISLLGIKVDDIKNEIMKVKEDIGIGGYGEYGYYSGNISKRLNELEQLTTEFKCTSNYLQDQISNMDAKISSSII